MRLMGSPKVDEVEFNLFHMSTNKKKRMYLDIGLTMHLCNGEDLVVNQRQAKGALEMKTNVGARLIEEEAEVPGLSAV